MLKKFQKIFNESDKLRKLLKNLKLSEVIMNVEEDFSVNLTALLENNLRKFKAISEKFFKT